MLCAVDGSGFPVDIFKITFLSGKSFLTPGFIPVDGWKVARAYERVISGVITGRIIKV
jgi:hypothetical protein